MRGCPLTGRRQRLLRRTEFPKSYTEARHQKSLHYFTGRPCKHGHIEVRLTSDRTCLECSRVLFGNTKALSHKREAARRYYWDHRDALMKQSETQARRDQRYFASLLRRYNLNKADYDALVESQNGLCALCKKIPLQVKPRPLFVDHCHKSGKVRGLVCVRCNTLLGFLEKSLHLLSPAVMYLVKHGSIKTEAAD